MEHTPGPWFAVGSYVRAQDKPDWPDWNVCEVNPYADPMGSGCVAAANARLIAAAPDLRAAAEAALDYFDETFPGMDFGVPAMLRDALARAEPRCAETGETG